MRGALIAAGVLLVVVAAGATQYFRPVPAVTARALPPPIAETAAPTLPCPATGAAAVAVEGIGDLGACGGATGPLRMYSTAKLMTALLVLHDHPLAEGQGGPELTISQSDVDNTSRRAAADESVVQVAAGEQLSELQLLQGLLIPSANNFADILATWDAGSVDAFVAKMNAEAPALFSKGGTHFADPSGVSDQTTSVPTELLALGEVAMAEPVIADIAGTHSTDLPVAGTVYNVDSQLGHQGVVGIKTGSDPHGQAAFVGLTLRQVGGLPVAIYTAVMGVADLPTAFASTAQLADAVAGGLRVWRVPATATVAEYSAPWGAAARVRPVHDLAIVVWPGPKPVVSYELRSLAVPAAAGTDAGTLTVTYGTRSYQARLVTAGALVVPGKRWRLTRGF